MRVSERQRERERERKRERTRPVCNRYQDLFATDIMFATDIKTCGTGKQTSFGEM